MTKTYLLEMPEALHKRVKAAAAMSGGKTMADIINEATAKFLGVTLQKGGKEDEPDTMDQNRNVHMG